MFTKNIFYKLFVFIIGLLILEGSFAQEKLVLGEIKGIAFSQIAKEVLTKAYQRMDVSVEFRKFPGQRSLVESDSGRIDGEIFRMKGIDKKYKNLVMVNVPIINMQSMVFTKGKTIKVDGWESIREYKLAARRGVKYVENASQEMDRVFVNSTREMFEKLDQGIVDVVVIDHFNGLKAIQEFGFKGIVAQQPPIQMLLLYHYLNKKHQQLIPVLTKHLNDLEEEGFIAEVQQRFKRSIQ